MFISHLSIRFTRNHNPLSRFRLLHGRTAINALHSQPQYKPTKRFAGKLKKPPRETPATPKAYMKDTIRNISNILRFSTWDYAQEQLKSLPIKWDSYTINQVLKTHPPMEKSWLFFNWAARLKTFKHDHFTYTTMIDIFGEAKRVSSMKFVFDQMRERGVRVDAVTYTSMMHWLSNDGDVDGSVRLWAEMKDNGLFPTTVSYTAYMKLLFDHGRVNEAAKVYREMIESGCAPNCVTYTVLIEHLAGSGKFNEALEIFTRMQETGVQPDKAACNILIEKCSKAGETGVMSRILRYMNENHLVLRRIVYTNALESLKTAGENDTLLKETNRHLSVPYEEHEPNDTDTDTGSVDRGLVVDLLTRNHFVALDFLLRDMAEKNVPLARETVSSVVETFCAHGRRDGALSAYDYATKSNVKLERIAYLSLVGLLIRTDSFTETVKIVEEMAKDRIFLGVNQTALLIYRLGCARKPVSAAKVFDSLPDHEKNTTAYTALMAAYFASRDGSKGLQTFETMKAAGVRCVLGTYNVLLAGLQRSGRIREADVYRKERKRVRNAGVSESESESACNVLFGKDFAC